MVSHYTTLVPSLGLHTGQPVRQASALACKGSVCHPTEERLLDLQEGIKSDKMEKTVSRLSTKQ